MIGRTFGNYVLVEELGRGGMGVVYKAQDTKLDRFVALKFLPQNKELSGDAKARFLREAQAASALDHANICTIHEVGETDDGEMYIVMAHYEGRTLNSILNEGPLKIARVEHLAAQLAAALERAYESGIIHRDVKPANIIVTDRDELKLLDFGLAKLTAATQLTQTGTTLGTVAYMSPEQATGKSTDAPTDIWSLGCVLYQMLTGQTPFSGEMPQAVMYSIVNQAHESLPPEVPVHLARVVDGCLSKNPAERPSAAQVRSALMSQATDADTIQIAGSPRRNRRRALLTVGGVIVLALVFVWVWNERPETQQEASAELDVNRVSVTPFSVRGSPELAYLGEGIVDLISTKFSGAGGLKAVDPRAVISLVAQLGIDVADPEAGRKVAERFGAGRYVTGDILELGGRIQLSAYLHDTDGGAPIKQAGTEGTEEDLFDVIDGLVAELLRGSVNESSNSVRGLEAVTTHSLPALKAFLEGERFLRAGRYREAAASYDRAATFDSTFAQAHYRKSAVADMIDAPDVRAAVDKAFEYASDLPQPQRDLVTALRLRRHGNSPEAEKVYRTILFQYPDEVEALVQLGELLFHENPRVGRSTLEATQPFRRAADLEPNNLNAHLHVGRLYAMAGEVDEVVRIADHFAKVAPESERADELEALRAYVLGDSLRQERLKQKLMARPWYHTWLSAHGVSRFARDPHGAAELAELRSDHPLLQLLRLNLHIVRGQFEAYRTYMEGLVQRRNAAWDLYEAFVLTGGVVPSEPERLANVIERLRRAQPDQLLSTGWIPPYWDLTERYAAFERDHTVALALIQLDRIDEARELIAGMAAQPPFEGLGSIHTDAVSALRAEILHQQGDPRGALDILRTVRCDAPHASSVRTLPDATRARFLRAELELQYGDVEVAKGFYVGFDDSWSFWDTLQRPLVYQRLGQIAEQEGDVDEAVLWYERLLEVWRDCDDALLPTRQAIQRKRDALIVAERSGRGS